MSVAVDVPITVNNLISPSWKRRAHLKSYPNKEECVDDKLVFRNRVVFEGKTKNNSVVELCHIRGNIYAFIIKGTAHPEDMLFSRDDRGGVVTNGSRDGKQFIFTSRGDKKTYIVDFAENFKDAVLKIKINYQGHAVLDAVYKLNGNGEVNKKNLNMFAMNHTIKPGHIHFKRLLK